MATLIEISDQSGNASQTGLRVMKFFGVRPGNLSNQVPVISISRRYEIVAICIALFALVLRLLEASQNSLNPDEALTFFIAQPSTWYERSLIYLHPPLFYFLLHYLQLLSDSELSLRLLPVFAGSLFPWVIWKWLARQHIPHAAFVAFLLLEFSPNLISLSAQVRGYTVLLLLVSLALLFLDEALEARSIRSLLLFGLCLYLAILTEYSAAFAVGAFGIYALLRLLPDPRPIRFSLAWAATQVGALALYAILYKSSIATLLAIPAKADLVAGYLNTAFPRPGEEHLIFAIAGTVKQFAYLTSSLSLGYLGLALFAGGILSLFLAGSGASQYRRRALGVAFLVAFVLALGASLLQLHPYGRSRQTVILALFSAPCIAFGCEWLFRRFPSLAIPTAFLLAGACYFFATPDHSNIPQKMQQLPRMVQAMQQLRTLIPAEAILLTDEETTWILHYYLGNRRESSPRLYANGMQESRIDSYRSFSFRWEHGSLARVNADLASLRLAVQMPAAQPVWVLDAGFYLLPSSIPSAQLLSSTLLVVSDASIDRMP